MSVTAPPTQDPTPEQQRIAQLEAELAAARRANAPRDDSDRPWTVAQEHGDEEHTRDVAPLPYRGEGAVLHHFPILTGGSGGNLGRPYVRALAELLAQAGYSTNRVIKGEITHYDNSLAVDVASFKADHDTREDVNAYQGHTDPAPAVMTNLTGPYTIQKLFEVVADKIEQPVEQLIARVEYDIARQL